MATVDHRHLPPHIIDGLLAGQLAEGDGAVVEKQGRACDVCRERLDGAKRAREAFLERNPPERRARELLAGVHTRTRRFILFGFPVATAAAVLLFFGIRQRPPDDGIVAKGDGGPTVGFTVHRAGAATRPGKSGEALRAGDTVELALGLGRFGHAHVFALEGDGTAKVLFDWSARLDGGGPPTLTLDAAPTTERIVVVFHDVANPSTELPDVRRAIARAYTGPGAGGIKTEGVSFQALEPNVAVRSILIRKEKRLPKRADSDVPTRP